MAEPTIPRMRLIDKAYGELKKLDPDMDLSWGRFYGLIKSGKVPVFTASPRRRLINLDGLIEYLNSDEFLKGQQIK